MRFKFKHKLGFAFSMIRVQFPVKLCYAMTVNKSQSQSFLQALFDTTVETFSHGQTYVALSRIRFYNTIRLIIKDENIITYNNRTVPTLLNCVYPTVILNVDKYDSDDSVDNVTNDFDTVDINLLVDQIIEHDGEYNVDIDVNTAVDSDSQDTNYDTDYDDISILSNQYDDI
jgi:hypothetical protein